MQISLAAALQQTCQLQRVWPPQIDRDDQVYHATRSDGATALTVGPTKQGLGRAEHILWGNVEESSDSPDSPRDCSRCSVCLDGVTHVPNSFTSADGTSEDDIIEIGHGHWQAHTHRSRHFLNECQAEFLNQHPGSHDDDSDVDCEAVPLSSKERNQRGSGLEEEGAPSGRTNNQRRKSKPSKVHRERYRMLHKTLQCQVEAAPEEFDFDAVQLPSTISTNEKLKLKLRRRLVQYRDSVLDGGGAAAASMAGTGIRHNRYQTRIAQI